MLDPRIEFDERYDADYGSTTFYFMAPKDLLKYYLPGKEFPEAVAMEISVECPTNEIEPYAAGVSASPTREYEDAYEDYDWYDIFISDEEIGELIDLALKKGEN